MGLVPGWSSLWMVFLSILAPNFVSVAPSMGILFPILRRNELSTLWSSYFLSFMCFANCILDSLSFWANMHLSVSAYHVRCWESIWQNPTPIHDKSPGKIRNSRPIPKHNKSNIQQTSSQYQTKWRKLKAIPLKSGTIQGCPLSPYFLIYYLKS